jgi:hypothetical protein
VHPDVNAATAKVAASKPDWIVFDLIAFSFRKHGLPSSGKGNKAR